MSDQPARAVGDPERRPPRLSIRRAGLAVALWVSIVGSMLILASPALAQDEDETPETTTTTVPPPADEETPTSEAAADEQSEQVAPEITVEHTASQATAIGPGENIRFTVTVANKGRSVDDELVVEITYRQGVFSVTAEEEPPGEVDADTPGILLWTIGGLEEDEELSLTYRATAAATFPAGVNVVQNGATAIIDGTPGRTQIVSVPLAAPQPTVSDDRDNVTELDANNVILIMAMLIALAAVVSVVVVWQTGRVLTDHADEIKQWKSVMSNVLSAVAVMVIATAVILLAIRGTIGEDGAVSILAGIAGYVLGRTTSD